MSNASLRVPSYRHHKPSGQAVVTVGGRDIYLGKYNSAASRAEYSRVIAEWTANGGSLTATQSSDLTVAELAAAFMRHAKTYYRGPDGKPTTEVANYKPATGDPQDGLARPRADHLPGAKVPGRHRTVSEGGPGGLHLLAGGRGSRSQ